MSRTPVLGMRAMSGMDPSPDILAELEYTIGYQVLFNFKMLLRSTYSLFNNHRLDEDRLTLEIFAREFQESLRCSNDNRSDWRNRY